MKPKEFASDYELHEERMRKVRERFGSYAEGAEPQEHFYYIVNSLLGSMKILSRVIKTRKTGYDKCIDHYLRAKKALDTYLDLIESSPKFRGAEFSKLNGFFPEIGDAGGAANYVLESDRKLSEMSRNTEGLDI